MSGESAQQDTDSGTGTVVTPGKPVKHVDILDGKSAGHVIEPEHDEGSTGNEPKPDAVALERAPRAEPPERVSRDDIYARAKTGRSAEIDGDLADMTDDQRVNYDRMIAEAGGGPDPYAEEDEPSAVAPATSKPAADNVQSQKNQPAGIDTPTDKTIITVYGMREEVPTADINAAGGIDVFQKMRAADVRLQRLSTYEATLRGWESQLSERAAGLERAPQPQAGKGTGTTESSPTDALGDTADVEAQAARVTEAFYSGDREEATSKLSEVLASIRSDAIRAAQKSSVAATPSGPSQESVNAEATARKEANAVFLNEFPDLNTPVLRQAALNMVNVVARDPVMIGRPLAEITREACGRIAREVFPDHQRPVVTNPANLLPAAGQQNPLIQPGKTPVDLGSRYSVKRRTVVQPLKDAHGRPAAEPTAKPFPSNSEFVGLLKRGRNQP